MSSHIVSFHSCNTGSTSTARGRQTRGSYIKVKNCRRESLSRARSETDPERNVLEDTDKVRYSAWTNNVSDKSAKTFPGQEENRTGERTSRDKANFYIPLAIE